MLTATQTKQIAALQDIVTEARATFYTEHLIIAGGAPRDILSRVPVKDIDVFVDLSSCVMYDTLNTVDAVSEWFMRQCKHLASNLGYPTVKLQFNEDNEYGVDVCDIEYGTGAPIQIVGLHNTNPIEDVTNYDFGLSQVFVTQSGVFSSQAAVMDRLYHTITYMDNAPDHASFLRSVKRFHRLYEKYFGMWQFINCEKLENYQND